MLVLALAILTLALVVWLVAAGLLVTAPHAIVTGTLGSRCVSDGNLDCFRAIADARQAVLFSVGGVIALVGIIFTYLRWRDDNILAKEALAEGKRSAQRFESESNQNRLDSIANALGLLSSDVPAKKFAAVSLLADYAKEAGDTKAEASYANTILGVLVAHIRERDHNSYERPGFPRTDKHMSLNEVDNLAIVSALAISAQRSLAVDFSGLTFVDIRAENSDWSDVNMDGLTFIRGSLAHATLGGTDSPRLRVRFFGTDLDKADFTDARLSDGYFGPVETQSGTGGYRPGDVRFSGADLARVEFRNADLRTSDMDLCDLEEVTIPGSTLPWQQFHPRSLIYCDFGSAQTLWFLNLRGTLIVGTYFGAGQSGITFDDGVADLDGLVYSNIEDEENPPAGHAEALARLSR